MTYAELYVAAARASREASLGMWATPRITQPRTGAALKSGGSTREVTIQCVRFNLDGKDNGRESVTLRGVQAVDLTSWWLVDEQDHRFLLEGGLSNGETPEVPNKGVSVWSHLGDTVSRYNAVGELVDKVHYRGSGSQACR